MPYAPKKRILEFVKTWHGLYIIPTRAVSANHSKNASTWVKTSHAQADRKLPLFNNLVRPSVVKAKHTVYWLSKCFQNAPHRSTDYQNRSHCEENWWTLVNRKHDKSVTMKTSTIKESNNNAEKHSMKRFPHHFVYFETSQVDDHDILDLTIRGSFQSYKDDTVLVKKL